MNVYYITTKCRYTQIYTKKDDYWLQTSPNGIIRNMTAEQLLFHIPSILISANKGNLALGGVRYNI